MDKKNEIIFRASKWFNFNTNKPMYGIQARIKPRKWIHCLKNDDYPLIFNTEEERDEKLNELKKEGYKINRDRS